MLQSTPDLGAQPVIQTAGLTKRYGSTLALDRLDLTIHAGGSTASWASAPNPAREEPPMQPNTQDSQPLKVIIAGGGVAGLESAFALHELAADRVAVTLIAPGEEFIYRPLSIGEPFTSSWAERYPLAPLASAAGAELVRDTLASVDPEARTIRTGAGTELSYDALMLGLGTSLRPYSAHATNVDDTRMEELLHGLVQDIEGGYTKRLAIVIPGPMPWPFPAYELALMASERAWDTQGALDVTVLTPERTPLEVFGPAASQKPWPSCLPTAASRS